MKQISHMHMHKNMQYWTVRSTGIKFLCRVMYLNNGIPRHFIQHHTVCSTHMLTFVTATICLYFVFVLKSLWRWRFMAETCRRVRVYEQFEILHKLCASVGVNGWLQFIIYLNSPPRTWPQETCFSQNMQEKKVLRFGILHHADWWLFTMSQRGLASASS